MIISIYASNWGFEWHSRDSVFIRLCPIIERLHYHVSLSMIHDLYRGVWCFYTLASIGCFLPAAISPFPMFSYSVPPIPGRSCRDEIIIIHHLSLSEQDGFSCKPDLRFIIDFK